MTTNAIWPPILPSVPLGPASVHMQDVSNLTHILMMVNLRPFQGKPVEPLIPFILSATIDSALRVARGTLPATTVLLAGIQDNLLRVADMLAADGGKDFADYAVLIKESDLTN
jgi:hypothetical protein